MSVAAASMLALLLTAKLGATSPAAECETKVSSLNREGQLGSAAVTAVQCWRETGSALLLFYAIQLFDRVGDDASVYYFSERYLGLDLPSRREDRRDVSRYHAAAKKKTVSVRIEVTGDLDRFEGIDVRARTDRKRPCEVCTPVPRDFIPVTEDSGYQEIRLVPGRWHFQLLEGQESIQHREVLLLLGRPITVPFSVDRKPPEAPPLENPSAQGDLGASEPESKPDSEPESEPEPEPAPPLPSVDIYILPNRALARGATIELQSRVGHPSPEDVRHTGEGPVDLNLAPGLWGASVRSRGYLPQEIGLNIEQGTNEDVVVTLQPDPVWRSHVALPVLGGAFLGGGGALLGAGIYAKGKAFESNEAAYSSTSYNPYGDPIVPEPNLGEEGPQATAASIIESAYPTLSFHKDIARSTYLEGAGTILLGGGLGLITAAAVNRALDGKKKALKRAVIAEIGVGAVLTVVGTIWSGVSLSGIGEQVEGWDGDPKTTATWRARPGKLEDLQAQYIGASALLGTGLGLATGGLVELVLNAGRARLLKRDAE